MAAQQTAKSEMNNYVRWGIGIVVTVILAVVVHIGNEGSVMKRRLANLEAVQSAHAENQRLTDKKIDRIEDKIDRLIERK